MLNIVVYLGKAVLDSQKKYFLTLLLLIAFHASIEAAAVDSSLYSSLANLANQTGEALFNRELLEAGIKKISSDIIPLSPAYINRIVQIAREHGLFLKAYRLVDKSTIVKFNPPFICYLEEEGFCLVTKLNMEKPQESSITYLDRTNNAVRKKELDFFNRWNGIILSYPVENMLVEETKLLKPLVSGEFVVIYSNHMETDFAKLSLILDELIAEAKARNWKLMYVDELGLIPLDTVKNIMQSSGVSQEQAFEQARKSIGEEDASIGKGIPIYDSSPLYSQLYSYLAGRKIKTIIEDLEYPLWERIVSFDEDKVYEEAALYFMSGDLNKYVEKMKEYMNFFWQYNMKMRDTAFSRQINKLIDTNPNTLIFTLRGLGHYGLEGNITSTRFAIKSIIMCDGKFVENFNVRTWLQLLWSNGVQRNLDTEKRDIACAFIQDCLTAILIKGEKLNIVPARIKSYNAVKKINSAQLNNLVLRIKVYHSFSLFKSLDDLPVIQKFIYDWAKGEGLI